MQVETGVLREIAQVAFLEGVAVGKSGKGRTGGWHSPKRVACCGWVWNECSFYSV
jgi:hypothetical protein